MIELTQAAAPTNSLKHLLDRLCRDESGQDMVEYALVSLAMGLLTVAGLHGLAASVSNDVNIIVNAFNGAIGLP